MKESKVPVMSAGTVADKERTPKGSFLFYHVMAKKLFTHSSPGFIRVTVADFGMAQHSYRVKLTFGYAELEFRKRRYSNFVGKEKFDDK